MGNLYRLSNAKSRSISPENFTGGKGMGEWLKKGQEKNVQGNLVSVENIPSININPAKHLFCRYRWSGAIQHIWMTATGTWRNSIL